MEIIRSKTAIDYSLLQASKLSFGKGVKTKPIYHYTSIGGLQGILSNKALRFTNIKYMNDKDEIIAGLDSIAKICNVPAEDQEKLRAAFINHAAQTFVCCFSLESDSLPMWNYYTKEIHSQGFNIEFDDKKLVESILRTTPLLDGCDFAFGKVDYSKDNDSMYSRVITNHALSSMEIAISKVFLSVAKSTYNRKAIVSEATALKEWEEKIVDSEKKHKLIDLPIYFYNAESCSFEKNASGNYIYFVKRAYFEPEHEFRIVITVPDEKLPQLAEEGIYKFRISNGVLIPYIELKFSEEVIKGITVSPTVQSDLIELSLQDFAKYCKLSVSNYKEFIKHSNIPVRF